MDFTFNLDHYLYKFLRQNAKSIFTIPVFERFEIDINENASCLIDFHPFLKYYTYFFCIRNTNDFINFYLSGLGTVIDISHNNKFGLLINSEKNGKKYFIWLPQVYSQICLDNFQRISISQEIHSLYDWAWSPNNQIKIFNLSNKEAVTIIPYVVIENVDENLFEEFQNSHCCENRLYLKSNWFSASTPKDIWKYLINGAIYDPRSDARVKKQFKCQQCAYAWWNYLGFLQKKTRKKIYDFLQNEISCAVLADMSSNGEWGHGYWSDDIETHSRFHLDGIQLFLSQYEKTNDSVWLDAAEKSMDFFSKELVEKIGNQKVWFLHDTLERKNKPKIKSTLCGKSIENSLCINTHVQALSVLHRLQNLDPDKKKYALLFNKGVGALRCVFEHQPGEKLYQNVLEWLIKYKFLNRSNRILLKIKNDIIYRLLTKIYWPIVQLYPRIVHPCGFIERDLTLSMLSDRYHVINLKDLVTLYRQQPDEWLRPYIKKGINVLREYVKNNKLEEAIQRSLYFIETIDTLYLYDKYIEKICNDELKKIENVIYEETGGYSLDYCIAREL